MLNDRTVDRILDHHLEEAHRELAACNGGSHRARLERHCTPRTDTPRHGKTRADHRQNLCVKTHAFAPLPQDVQAHPLESLHQ
eukprot:2032044-Pyramimonas_sp.AAC.1